MKDGNIKNVSQSAKRGPALSDLPPLTHPTDPSQTTAEGEKPQLDSIELANDQEKPKYIGDASMDKDGTINIHFRKTADGKDANAYVHYRTTDPYYQETLDHLKGLTPGETVLVTPFPDDSASDDTHQK